MSTPPVRSSVPRQSRHWWLLAAWLLGLALVRAASVEERDPYWQARAGWENLRGAPVSRPDTWSWAPVPGPFRQTSPLWNVALGGGWHTFGYAGAFAVALVAIGLCLTATVLLARRLGARALPSLLVILAGSVLVLPMFSPRATVLAQALYLWAVLAGDSLARSTAARHLFWGPVAVLVGGVGTAALGSWIHLSWSLFAGALALSWACLWWMSPRIERAIALRLTLSGTLGLALGALLGPFGPDALEVSAAVRAACAGLITEWMSPFSAGLALRWSAVAVIALVAAALTVRLCVARRRAGRDSRTGLVMALGVLGVPAALGGLGAVRFLGVAVLALQPVAAMAATVLVDRAQRRARQARSGWWSGRQAREWTAGRAWAVVLTASLVALAPGAVLLTAPLATPRPENGLLHALPHACRLFSDPGAAAPVILSRPDVPVWIDGRADYYGRGRLRDALAYFRGSAATAVPPGTTCVLVVTDGPLRVTGLRARLGADPHWTRVATSGAGEVWLPR